jgi:hypothetical protein
LCADVDFVQSRCTDDGFVLDFLLNVTTSCFFFLFFRTSDNSDACCQASTNTSTKLAKLVAKATHANPSESP